MARDRSKSSTGPGRKPAEATPAEVSADVADEAPAGDELPEAEAVRIARKIGASTPDPREKWDRKSIATGVAMGIGSAAVVAAMLYATRPKRPRR